MQIYLSSQLEFRRVFILVEGFRKTADFAIQIFSAFKLHMMTIEFDEHRVLVAQSIFFVLQLYKPSCCVAQSMKKLLIRKTLGNKY